MKRKDSARANLRRDFADLHFILRSSWLELLVFFEAEEIF